MTKLKYPEKVQNALEKKGFFNISCEERLKKHQAAINKANKLLTSEDKKLLISIVEDEMRWPD